MLKLINGLAYVLLIATSFVAVSCGGETGESIENCPDSCQRDSSAQDTSPVDTGVDADKKDAPQENETTTDVEIPQMTCTGSATQIVLSATRYGGGPMAPAQDLLSRNGWYVLVTGDCTVHCGTITGLVYSAKFDEARITEMLADFEVDLIDKRQGHYPGGCTGAPDDIVSYDGKSIHFSTCGDPKVPEWITNLDQAAKQWRDRCVAEAEPVTGDMRYTVIEEPAVFGPKYHPVAWPLDVSLESVLEDPDLYLGHIAKDEQATILRDLRAKALDGQLGPDKTHWIPVNDSDKNYSLYVSDTCVLEDADGKIPFAFRK